MRLNDIAIVYNTRDCPKYYNKFINKHGKISIIDTITFANKSRIYVKFINDEKLNQDYYQYCKINKIATEKPIKIPFFSYNLKIL